jgi:hypothetical protein
MVSQWSLYITTIYNFGKPRKPYPEMRSNPDRASFGYPLLRMPFHSCHCGVAEYSSIPCWPCCGPLPSQGQALRVPIRFAYTGASKFAEPVLRFLEGLKQVRQRVGFGQGHSRAQGRDSLQRRHSRESIFPLTYSHDYLTIFQFEDLGSLPAETAVREISFELVREGGATGICFRNSNTWPLRRNSFETATVIAYGQRTVCMCYTGRNMQIRLICGSA